MACQGQRHLTSNGHSTHNDAIRAAPCYGIFVDKALGKVVPYGVYDVAANEGWFSIGITADTADTSGLNG